MDSYSVDEHGRWWPCAATAGSRKEKSQSFPQPGRVLPVPTWADPDCWTSTTVACVMQIRAVTFPCDGDGKHEQRLI